jgi:hypothetical protein
MANQQPDRGERRIDRERPAGAVAEEQRVHGLRIEELLAVPAVGLQ